MIHALHGHFGLPSDWDAALPSGTPAKAWHLWEIRRQHPEARTLTGFATWFNNQIAALPPDPRRVLAGYSLGGRLALHVLADRPALWHRVLIISAHPGLTSDADRTARLAHDAAWQERCLTAPWPEVCAAWNAQPILQSPSASGNPTNMEPWCREIAGAFAEWSLGQQAHLLLALAANPATGIWLTGAEDEKFTTLTRTATAILPGFQHQTIPAAGHRLLHERPKAVRAALVQLSA